MTCPHDHLTFNSGDYYLHCLDCHAYWGRINIGQPEYGTDANGIRVGCWPELCQQDFVMGERVKCGG
jgi:hypothetical protein